MQCGAFSRKSCGRGLVFLVFLALLAPLTGGIGAASPMDSKTFNGPGEADRPGLPFSFTVSRPPGETGSDGAPLELGTAQPLGGDCMPHPPIRITEDEGPQGLILGHAPITGEPVYRPGSGVIGGTGTAADPYLISGWCIEATRVASMDVVAVDIRNTQAHVRFTDNELTRSSIPHVVFRGGQGIVVQDVRNLSIDGNQVTQIDEAVEVSRSSQIMVQGNRIDRSEVAVLFSDVADAESRHNRITQSDTGFRLRQSDSVTLSDNVLLDNVDTGVQITNGTDVRVIGNDLTTDDVGVDAENTLRLSVFGNTISSGGLGTYLDSVTDSRIELNGFWADGVGIAATGIHDVTIKDNGVVSGSAGIHVERSMRPVIFGNQVTGGEYGVSVFYSKDGHLEDNHLTDTSYLIYGDRVEEYDHAVEGNSLDGRPLWYGYDVEDADVPSEAGQVFLADSQRVTMSGLDLHESVVGVLVVFSEEVVIEDSTFRDQQVGVFVEGSDAVEIQGNHLEEHHAAAMTIVHQDVDSDGETLIEHNSIDGGVVGIRVLDRHETAAGSTRILANELTGNEVGLLVSGISGKAVHDNNFHGNFYAALDWDMENPLDARFNWWGCPDGPEDPACDQVSDDIDYAPWRSSPNPDAGAS